MKTICKINQYMMLGVYFCLLNIFSACEMPTTGVAEISLAQAGAPVIWLDQPRNPTQGKAGEFILVQAHARDGDGPGVTLVGLYINGELWESKNTDTSSPLVDVLFDSWVPQNPGEYLVEVEAINEFGVTSSRASAWVSVEPKEIVVAEVVEAEPEINRPTNTPTHTKAPEESLAEPQHTPTPTFTEIIEYTVTPSFTPTFTFTPSNTPTTAVATCTNKAQWRGDVTYDDGTVVDPGETINKIWRIENTGTCTWDAGYRLTYHGGDFGSENSPYQFTSTNVMPGAQIEISMNMAVPTSEGTKWSHWKMRSSSGETFLFGPASDSTLYVEIVIVDGSQSSQQEPEEPSCPHVPPDSVSASRNGDQVTITWSDVPCATGYMVEVNVCWDQNQMQYYDMPNVSSPYTITDKGLCSEKSWGKVRTCFDPHFCNDSSPWKEISWPAAVTKSYDPPGNIKAVRDYEEDKVEVTWTIPLGAVGVHIETGYCVGENYDTNFEKWVKSPYTVYDNNACMGNESYGKIVACYNSNCSINSGWVDIPWP